MGDVETKGVLISRFRFPIYVEPECIPTKAVPYLEPIYKEQEIYYKDSYFWVYIDGELIEKEFNYRNE